MRNNVTAILKRPDAAHLRTCEWRRCNCNPTQLAPYVVMVSPSGDGDV